jgi:hypothetical protein
MSAIFFAAGCIFGTLWTLVLTRCGRVGFRIPSLRAGYAEVTVTDAGANKIPAIKQIRAYTGYGLKEAKEASEGAPFTLAREDARALVRALNAWSASATVRPVRRPK